MYNLRGKVALVTGTAKKRGLGRTIALRLAKEGAHVVVTDKPEASQEQEVWEQKEGWRGLDSLVKEIEVIGQQCLAIEADICNSQEVEAMVEKAIGSFGKIDILVNNAAVVARDIGKNTVVDTTNEVWDLTIGVNLSGVFYTCRAVARHMVQMGLAGRIINISSASGKKAEPRTVAYAASKFGVIGLTQGLALELAQHKITVNAVCPGLTVTWGTRGQEIYQAVQDGLTEEEAITKIYTETGLVQKIPLGRPGSVEDVTNAIVFLASDQSDFITGQAINVNGGMLISH